MERPSLSCLFALVLAGGGASALCGQEGGAPPRPGAPDNGLPHVVFILADDLGMGDVGAYNPDSKIPTPHLDRLAEDGIRLLDAHSPSAVCSPTRYGILTGRYAWRTPLKQGVLWGDSPCLVEAERDTVAKLLRRAGYATAAVGKWHLGFGADNPVDYERPLRPGPLELGFDSFYGIPASLDIPPYVYVEDDAPEEEASAWTMGNAPHRSGGSGFWREGRIAPRFRHEQVLAHLTDRAVRVLEEHAEQDDGRPLFLYYALTAPHTPWLPTDAFRGKSRAGPYGDFVAHLDHSVGRVLDALDRLGMAGNTLLIVTSDNGAHWTTGDIARFGHRSNLSMRGQKGDIWEGGHRVPFLARWPGQIAPGTTGEALVGLIDLYATCAEIAGEPHRDDAGEDSSSMLALLRGEGRPDAGRFPMVLHSFHGTYAVRDGAWKLILQLGSGGFTQPPFRPRQPGEPAGQLYDLRKDPGETKNVYGRHPQVVARLEGLLKEFQRSGRSRPRPASGDPESGR